jgi:hypothetical protein
MEALGARGVIAPTHSLHEGEWSAWRPGRALLPGKGPPVPIVQEAGWAPEPVWRQRLEEKSFRLCRGSNLHRPVVQSVTRHYTDWATRLTLLRNERDDVNETRRLNGDEKGAQIFSHKGEGKRPVVRTRYRWDGIRTVQARGGEPFHVGRPH